MKQYISLFNALPYFKVLDEYFGQCLPGLAIMLEEVEMNGEGDDRNIRITERVSGPDLLKAFEKAELETERDGFRYVDLLWLVCNMYYGENYFEFSDAQANADNGAGGEYDNIRKSSAKLFVFFEEYERMRGTVLLEREKIEKSWDAETREMWRKRRAEIRKEKEREWGEEVNGPDWKYVEEEIAKEADSIIESEREQDLHNRGDWKKISAAYDDLERVTLKIGDTSLALDNASWWVVDLFRNHLFPHFIDDIKTVGQAKAKYVKKPGKKPEDNRITAIVYGISQLFFDRGLVETKTQRNLSPFIQDILRLMKLKNNAGKIPTTLQIEKMIENLPKAKTDPKFFSASLRPTSKEGKLRYDDDPKNALIWLMSRSKK